MSDALTGSGVRQARAFSPASVANVAVGFDLLGYAVPDIGDTVTVRRIDAAEVRIVAIRGAAVELPLDAPTAFALLEQVIGQMPRIERLERSIGTLQLRATQRRADPYGERPPSRWNPARWDALLLEIEGFAQRTPRTDVVSAYYAPLLVEFQKGESTR